MRADLLRRVANLRDVTNAILLTHNIDFVFLQTVVMSYLRKCGDPALTIFADADCAAATYRAQRELLDGIGTRYRVVPVRMHPGFVFHPKALMLAGPGHATLFVGSGNLTFGGWRQNGEVWTQYSAGDDGRTVFDEFRAYVEQLISRIPLAGSIQLELEDAYDPRTKQWVVSAPAGAPALLGRADGGERRLLDLVAAALGDEPADELVVCSPYFDAGGDALAALRMRMAHRRSLLLHPGRGSTLTAQAWAKAGEGMERRPCAIRHEHEIEGRAAFVHAKFYAAIRGDTATIVQGSANCSRAALLMDGTRGNAELMSVVRTSAEAFRRDWLAALPEVADAQALPEEAEQLDEAPTPPALQILAARAEDGLILVAFRPTNALVTRSLIDGKQVPFTAPEVGVVRIPHVGAASALCLEGQVEGMPVSSQLHWVDQEGQLRSTARRRRFEDAIPRALGGEKINADEWLDLLQALGEHFKYTPVRGAGRVSPAQAPSETQAGTRRRYEDLFATEYSPANLLSHWRPVQPSSDSHDSIRKLLLRWLGIGPASAPPETAAGQGEGDMPEELIPKPPSRPEPRPKPDAIARTQKKLGQILQDIEKTITSADYVETRTPDFLRLDLMLTSAILQFGFAKGWLRHEDFFAFTHRAWTQFFLSGSRDPGKGDLEWRRDQPPDPAAFAQALSGPQLSAALIAWSFIGVNAPPSIERARFLLARAVSIARMQELWIGGAADDISRELQEVLRASMHELDAEHVIRTWRDALMQGSAIRALAEGLQAVGLEQARSAIYAPAVAVGDLLWQGRAGYCIALEAGSRESEKPIKTLKLQWGGTGEFQGHKTLPVRAVLASAVLPHWARGIDPARVAAFLDELGADARASTPTTR